MIFFNIVYVCIQVVFTEAFRAKKYHGRPPHHYDFEENAADPIQRVIGTQILLDILLLAKSDHFLHAESSVASLASYFNPNMTSTFMEPKKKNKVPFKPMNLQSVDWVMEVGQNFTRSLNRLSTLSPRYVMVTCLTHWDGVGGRGVWRVRSFRFHELAHCKL